MKTQVVIFGGGVAGLWLLNRLRQQNIACVLVENKQLGSGQTIYSQGIIHSGMKYALHGKLTVSAEAMREMPNIWRTCLQGQGEIDLSSVNILSEYQYMWSPGSLAANLAILLASKNVKSQAVCLTKSDYPEIFSTPNFKGVVYRLEEPVLAVKTLVEVLAHPYKECLLQAELESVTHNATSTTLCLRHLDHTITLETEHIVLLAGKGNQELAQKFGLTTPKMQRRPLLMVAVTAPQLPLLYAHAIQVSDKPRITITTHHQNDGTVWYLGGDLAETGVHRKPAEQIQFARHELRVLFPHLDVSRAKFETFFIERAEALLPSGKKPDGPTVVQEGNVITAWPTKLAFSPLLARQIVDQLPLTKQGEQVSFASQMQPAVADYPWSHD